MDEVRVNRLIDKYKKNGEQPSEDPFLVMLKNWPLHRSCRDNSNRLLGLEQQVHVVMWNISIKNIHVHVVLMIDSSILLEEHFACWEI